MLPETSKAKTASIAASGLETVRLMTPTVSPVSFQKGVEPKMAVWTMFMLF